MEAIFAGDVQTAEGAVGRDGGDIFVFQFQLPKAEYEGGVYDDGADKDPVLACRCDEMSHRLVDKDDVALGDCDIVLVTGDVGLSFPDILKFDFLMPVPVYDGGIRRGAVNGDELYGIAAEQKFLCSFFIKIRFHVGLYFLSDIFYSVFYHVKK